MKILERHTYIDYNDIRCLARADIDQLLKLYELNYIFIVLLS